MAQSWRSGNCLDRERDQAGAIGDMCLKARISEYEAKLPLILRTGRYSGKELRYVPWNTFGDQIPD